VEDATNLTNLPTIPALQFGHGGEAVEDVGRAVSSINQEGLQFGHGGEAVEDVQAAAAGHALPWLQFGHGGEAVEDDPSPVRPDGRHQASIRPRR